jgi:hypothetical protein
MRAAIGSHVGTGGTRGVDAAAGFGMGWSFDGHQGLFVSANGGVTTDGHARAIVYDRFEYLSQASVPYSLAFRAGMRLPRTKYGLAPQEFGGVGFAIYPFHSNPGPHEDHSDDSWATAPIGPDVDLWDEIGFELDADAVQGQGGVLTVNLVVAADTLLAK